MQQVNLIAYNTLTVHKHKQCILREHVCSMYLELQEEPKDSTNFYEFNELYTLQ